MAYDGLGNYFYEELPWQSGGQLPEPQPFPTPRAPSEPELRSYSPTFSEKLGNWMQDALIAGGMDPYRSGHLAHGVRDLLALNPVTGVPIAAGDVVSEQAKGNPAGAALAAFGVLPGAKTATAFGPLARELGAVARVPGSLETIMRPALPETSARFGSPMVAPVAAPAPTGRAPAITSVDLRAMPLDEAIKVARTEQHIIPSPTRKGGFVGAPGAIRGREQLEAMRNTLDEAARLGGDVGGETWYARGRDAVSELAQGDPKRTRLLSQELGLTSQQATPETNLGFAILGHNAIENAKPLDIVRNKTIAKTMRKAREAGTDIPLGQKTGPYAQNLDPAQPWSTASANDLWAARGMGYSEREIAGGLGPQPHAFMDAETVLGVDRANRGAYGGRTNWVGPEVQAAGWVGKRIQEELKKGVPLEKAMQRGGAGYPESLQKHTAYAPTDPVPGVGTGHRPDIVAGTPAAEAYGKDPRSSFSRLSPYNEQPYDVYHRALGLWQRPTLPTTGIFESQGGPLEIARGEAARSMVGFTGGSGKRVIDPNSMELLRAAEGAKAYGNAQNMGSALVSVPTNQASRLGSVEFLTGGRQFTPEEVKAIQALGGEYGLPHLAHVGDRAFLTNWADTPNARATARALDKGGLGERLAEIIPGANARRTELQSAYTDALDFQKAMQASNARSGLATQQLQTLISPHNAAKLDASPEVRADMLGRLERDIEGARGGAQVRADLQRAREIIVKEGFTGLFEALAKNKGKAGLPAILPLLIPYLQQVSSPDEG